MKPCSPGPTHAAPSPVKARNCALLNQLATPGLGSLMAGRKWAGAGQLALALAGCEMIFWWFMNTVTAYYGLIFDHQAEPSSFGRWGLAGATVFAVSWFWALVTSIGIYRQTRAAPPVAFETKPNEPPELMSP